MFDWDIREKVVELLLWSINKIEPSRNDGLAYRLHKMAKSYAKRPNRLCDHYNKYPD